MRPCSPECQSCSGTPARLCASAQSGRPDCWFNVKYFQRATMSDKITPGAKIPAPRPTTTKATGQKRSLERGKSTRKKNPGKRAKQGG